MSRDEIIIKGARNNNLKNIDLTIPKNKLVVFTGLSGSGKSTLAFDTIYNEGQRRFVESLSSYARQFLGGVEKPDVDSIEGLSPAISIDQKTTSNNPRSTVGTVTEIYDYLRLLYARIGIPFCPTHNEPIIAFTATEIVNMLMANPERTRLQVLSPIVRDEKGTHKETLEKIRAQGFERLRVDGSMVRIGELAELEKNKRHSIDIVIDRIVLKDDIRSRLFDAVTLALDWSHGYIRVLVDDDERFFSSHHTCKYCGFSVPKLEPRLFSFNAPIGCCPDCNGLGIKQEVDPELLVPNPNLSINQGAIDYYKNTVGTTNLEWQEFALLCDLYKIPRNIPFRKLEAEQRHIIFYGSPVPHKYVLKSSSGNLNHRDGIIEGVKNKIERLYRDTSSEFMRDYYKKFLRDTVCTTCHGARLNPAALSVRINDKNIYQVTQMSIRDSLTWFLSLDEHLSPTEKEISKLVTKEITNRLQFLANVGLNYLTLDRMAMTLSGGEAQRIRLATQIGSRLSGVLYVLDEPSIGLHQRDNDRLIATMKGMVDLGNTLIVVEHDEDTMRAADYLVDIGPGAGIHGGEVVATGSIEDLEKAPRSLTGKYLSGEKYIPLPPVRLKGNGKYLTIKGARQNNLKNLTVKIPLGEFVAITGVSGSGKSSLITEILYKGLKRAIGQGESLIPGDFDSIEGTENIDKIVDISQEPIGRTPRSNPATYTKAFDEIRDLFAETVEAKSRGFNKGTFSFNVPGGRCENCQGAGVTRIPMNFLPDVYVKCDVCDGHRYNEETLSVTYKGKNIYDVLNMTVEDALAFFVNRSSIERKIQTLNDVGLDYIKLGQPATELSGGEAQRVKLAFELQKKPTGKTIYILDEPTTGLHTDDIARLLDVLQKIVNNGDTVVVIEHNLDVIKVADWIIDLGPEGGDGGGQIVATGTPEQVADNPKSYTGQYLKPILEATRKAMRRYAD
ncbi:MAG TPA: excinuclease ABC subunit UvrA [Bacilli bacterium]|nr:excinuclease ABC subunit UvrA [Bacilli bacterium]